MLLNVRERIWLNSILPGEGDVRTMKTIQTLRMDLLFNEEEVKKFAIKSEGNTITWDPKVETETEITIGDIGTEIIVKALKKLDGDKKINVDCLSLWEKFCEGA